MRALITSNPSKDKTKWCKYTSEAGYTRNISNHQAIELSSYEAIFGIKPHCETLRNPAKTREDLLEAQQRQQIQNNQQKYSAKVINQSLKQKK